MTTLEHRARCFVCEWTAEGLTADREAAKHTEKHGHATESRSAPAPTRPRKG